MHFNFVGTTRVSLAQAITREAGETEKSGSRQTTEGTEQDVEKEKPLIEELRYLL